MTKIIQKIQTTIQAEQVGSLSIIWDLKYWTDYSASTHPDDTGSLPQEEREISKIHTIELQLYDKVGIDITEKVLNNKSLIRITEEMLMDAIQDESISQLKN